MKKREIVWHPTPAYVENSATKKFMDQHNIPTYDDFLKQSENIEWFWDEFIKFAEVEFYSPYSSIINLTRGMPFPRWFVGGKINIAHNALDKWALNPHTALSTAITWEAEDGTMRNYSFADLHAEANKTAHALQSLGIIRGDRVAIYMPMIPETVAAVFGIYKMGGVVVPLFSGFGAEALCFRLTDVEAKAVITADGFFRNGIEQPLKSVLDTALEVAKSVKVVIVVNRLGKTVLTRERDWDWAQVVKHQSPDFETIHTESEEVCMVSYSSGTSGKPKGIVQVHGGVAVKSAEFGLFNYDMRPGDVIHQITDFGWMMGQAPMLRAFSVGATLLLYEGSPYYPTANRVYELIEKHRVSVFGASATALRILKSHAPDSHRDYKLDSLRLLTHTGELIDEDTWMWYFGWRARQVPIINVSGGTELFAEILCSSFMRPLKATCLGTSPAIRPIVVDESGNSVSAGTTGYLGFELPQPAQTRGFWKEDNSRYIETYFARGSEYWWHGDIVVVDEDGYWFHQGRADDIIKVAGRRVGPGEIEETVNQLEGIQESAVIGVPSPMKGEEIVVFVVPKSQNVVEIRDIRQHIIKSLGKPFEPSMIHFVTDLPKTRSSKIIRRLIKQHYLGQQINDLSSVSNLDALQNLPVSSRQDLSENR